MIEVRKVESESNRWYSGGSEDNASPPGIDELRHWLEAFAQRLSTSRRDDPVDAAVVADLVEKWDGPYDEGPSPYETVARQTLAMSTAADDQYASISAVAAGFYFLKQRGLEPGRSPADDWRINRLFNAGSRAVDAMIEDPRRRSHTLRVLLFRILDTAMEQARFSSRGVVSTITCGVDWDGDGSKPLRRSLPEGAYSAGGVETGEIIDWLLQELVSRSLAGLTLNSVIEGGSEQSEYIVDDLLGNWMAGLSADEAHFVAGALFLPASIGGWPQPPEQRILDALAVAQDIAGEFLPDEAKQSRYEAYLRRIDSLRRLPDRMGPTFEVHDGSGDGPWRGRFGLTVYPVRCAKAAQEGFFQVEAGFYFEDEGLDISHWSSTEKRHFIQRLTRIANTEDDEGFSHFGTELNKLVDRINRAVGPVGDEGSDEWYSDFPLSPLWRDIEDGIDAAQKALHRADVDALAEVFRRWTVCCVAVSPAHP